MWIEVNEFFFAIPRPEYSHKEEYSLHRQQIFSRTISPEEFQALEAQKSKSPEWAKYQQDLLEWGKIPVFSHKIEVGMLIEFSNGERVLVGDCTVSGDNSGWDDYSIPKDAFVTRYRMVNLED